MKDSMNIKKEFNDVSNKLIETIIQSTKNQIMLWNRHKLFSDLTEPTTAFDDFIQTMLGSGLAFLSNDSYFCSVGDAYYHCLTFISLKNNEKFNIVAYSKYVDKIFFPLMPSDDELPVRLYNLIRFSISDSEDDESRKLQELKSAYDSLNNS